MYFVESGIAMEKDPQISMSSHTMFAETVELLKYEPIFIIIDYLHYQMLAASSNERFCISFTATFSTLTGLYWNLRTQWIPLLHPQKGTF